MTRRRHALDEILLVGACMAFAGAVVTLLLIRERDFVDSTEHEAKPGEREPSTAAA